MKIQIASDLHLEMHHGWMPHPAYFRPAEDRDVLVLAGDINVHTQAEDFVLRELDISPVVYVPGNHEYYCEHTRDRVDSDWKTIAKSHPDFHYLVAECTTIDGIRFFGAPWYSDLWNSGDPWDWTLVHESINDFYDRTGGRDLWSVMRHINMHKEQTEVLLAEPEYIDVVITHWPPTKQAIHSKYDGDELNPYFINDHEDVVSEIGAKLWISGHTHEPYDYWSGATRCVGNPAGYPGEYQESKLFRPNRVVEVD